MPLAPARLARIALAVLSGLVLIWAQGLHPLWPLAWLAPIPLLWAAFQAGFLEALLLAFLAGTLQGLGSAGYYATTAGPALAPALVALIGLLWSAVVVSARAIVVRTRGPLAMMAYPVAWAAVDTVLAAVSPHGTMGSLAYSQMDAPPVIQIAALAGTPGVCFLLSIPASTIAVWLYRRPVRPWLSVGLPVLLLAGGLAFGFARLSTGTAGAPIRFGLAAVDRPSSDDTRATAREPAIWGTYRAAVDQLGRRGAQMIVLPEAIDIVPPSRAPALLSELSGAARTSRVWLLAGVATADGARMSNRAWAFAPDGGRVADYAKHHPAPGEADLITPGTGYSIFDLDGRRAGVAICKDLDFPALPRRYGQMGSSVMVVPASDFGMDGWLHARMAILRGVEDGFYVVRAAEHGLLSVSDPFGRVLAQTPSQPGGGATLMVQAQVGPRIRTVYSRIGDVFGDLSIVALLAGLVAVAVRPSRPVP